MIDEIPVEAWEKVLSVNVTGAFLCARAAFHAMRRQSPQGGRIINNGSISAHAPRPGSVPYTVSKHAISGLTKSLALDGRPYSISCGQIDIGNAATEMTKRMETGARQADGQTRPEPVMDVRHVADAVVHMASLPPGANILSMVVMASGMPFVGRG
jgi:NAD(P)-dependent dehydrogenase (short-subunit alcohol dehydrogenase family)